jgi:uncharacterized membrane protein YbhN (UPF0104 family)
MYYPSFTRRWLVWSLRVLIVVLVIAGVSQTFTSAWARLDDVDWTAEPLWLVAGAAFYILGLAPMAWFWHQTLIALGQDVSPGRTLRAYFVGHLGKYFPGKALVLVIRIGALRPSLKSTWLAVVSTALETLMMMAVGAFLAAALAMFVLELGAGGSALAFLLAASAFIPTLPPVTRRIARAGLRRFPVNIAAGIDVRQLVAPLTWRLWMMGWIASLACWTLLGLSLWATLRAIGVDQLEPLADMSFLVGSVALAVVAGFLSMLPGGVIVRDALMMQLLAPVCGEANALVAAVLLRIVWLVSELVICGILYGAAFRARSR